MPTPYGEPIFRALHESGSMNLLVHYRKERVPSHPWKTNLRKGHISRIQSPILGIDWFLIKEVIIKKNAFFVGGWSGATLVLIITICMILKRKFIFESDAPNIHKKRSWLFSKLRGLFLKAGFRHAAIAILHTGDIAAERLKKMGAPEDKLFYFPYWVDTEKFSPLPNKRYSRDPFLRFVSVGRVLNERKGHDLAIHALAKVYRQNNKFNFEYLVAGTGPDIEELVKLSEELGVAEKVKIAGWVEPDELIKILQNSDILIHPSPVDEPYGVAVIEAMATGLVVVASDVTFAALDRVVNGVNGFIYNARNVEEIVQRITWCFENKYKLYEIGASARYTASQLPVTKGVEIIKEILIRSDVPT